MAKTYEIWRRDLSTDNRYDIDSYTKILDVTPTTEIKFETRLEDGEIFYREQLSEDVTFVNPDFNYLLDIKNGSSSRLGYIFVILEDSVIRWKGFFAFNQGLWDEDECFCQIKTNVFDEYSCILNSYKIKRNILDFGGSVVFDGDIYSYYEFRTVEENPCNIVEDTDGQWTVIHRITQTTDCGGSPTDLTYQIGTIQARKRSIIDVGGWTEIEENGITYYVTTIGTEIISSDIITNTSCVDGVAQDVVGYKNLYDGCTIGNVYGENSAYLLEVADVACYIEKILRRNCSATTQNVYIRDEVYNRRVFVDTQEYTNGRFLSNVLSSLVSEQASQVNYPCGYTVKSEFLSSNINPLTGETPNQLNNLTLSQITDIKNPNSTEKASILNYGLFDITLFLKDMFDLWWYIDSDGYFRLEHRKYFENNLSYTTPSVVGIDATTKKDNRTGAYFIAKTNNYTYDNSSDILKTVYSFKQSQNENFVGVPVLYSDESIPVNLANSEEQVTVDITTDFRFVTGRPSDVANDGGMLLQLEVVDNSEIVLNGDFSSDSVWEKSGGASIAGGVGVLPTGAGIKQESTDVKSVRDFDYSITISSASSAKGLFIVGGNKVLNIISNGTYSGTFTLSSDVNNDISVTCILGSFNVDNISLKLSENQTHYLVASEAGRLNSNVLQNNHLSWANLQERYLTYGRKYADGIVNNKAVTFDSSIKKKLQQEISFPICNNEYNPIELIRTNLGDGEVVESEENFNTGILTVNLKYE